MPKSVNPLDENDPREFFYNILYEEEDHFSFITSDYPSFKASLDGVPESMGYSPAFGRFQSNDKVFIVVEYVYPNSPASSAGLKRGDIILTIDGIPLDTANYRELYNQNSYMAGIGVKQDESIVLTEESVSLTSQVIVADPVLANEVIETGGKKIGYLAYAEFISGQSNEYIQSLDLAISKFIDEEIDELVVDLRYNPGGQVNVAGYLASCIAPASVVAGENVLVSYIYNDFLTAYFEENRSGSGSDPFEYQFPGSNYNLNLDQVYFLTTSGSASASELVMIGLDPYMDVTIIGDSTYGKYTGAWVYPDTQEPARHDWAIIPIVLKYGNAVGFTDFKTGLVPDYLMEDDLLNPYPLGDPDDPLLAKAIELITGIASSRKTEITAKGYLDLAEPGMEFKSNLYLNAEIPAEEFHR